ncbi:DUF695 domain-containing protein [Luteipulveratus mongoliensis]|uniref:DUF695 domain-containing protein n=1 Tax=Luteipulveratus mongoliensis TaxID=571913 RepID=A0A0K1JHX4_9MICO|nr:DUF695 domain-containing protein [Luteipulveratus mongoliensis]AKU16301.1 hypothetical protein VV02_11225 [Luteipulveratus mongoliensis]
MALWGRSKRSARDSRQTQIDAFWQWWSDEGAQQCASALGDGGPELVNALLAPKVDEIARGLAWEAGPGSEAIHQLVVTADGDPELRAVARRWLTTAPETDIVWCYADSRQPAVDIDEVEIDLEDHQVQAAQATVGVRRQGVRVDVTVHHPVLRDLDEPRRAMAAFLLLDAALGEEQTETWIGELVPSLTKPLDGFGLRGLISVVRDLREEFRDEDGKPVWVTLEGQGFAGPVVAVAQVPLAAPSAPELDTYVAVVAEFADRTEDGLPGEKSVAALQRLESAIAERLGDSGRLVAHETTGGARRLHCYVDGTVEVPDLSDAWGEGKLTTHVEYDPGWSAVQHLRG